MNATLTASYMGIELKSPIIVGPCPLTLSPQLTSQFIDAGVGAITLPSILQEQLVYASMKQTNPIAAIEQSGYCPQQDRYNAGPDEYLKTIQCMKAQNAVPIIASIHGASLGAWLDFVKQVETSGADALELNWQIGRCEPDVTSSQIENRMIEFVRQVRARVTIPIAVKVSDRFPNLTGIAIRLQKEGANGLILFSHRPQWDVDTDRKHWTVRWELTPIGSLGRTIEGIVEVHSADLKVSIAASGGVRSGDDAIKTIIAGSDVAMVVSEVYRQGPDAIREINAGIQRFLRTTMNRCSNLSKLDRLWDRNQNTRRVRKS
jgi:dihydroorotate dehydrogenase (fumarate)